MLRYPTQCKPCVAVAVVAAVAVVVVVDVVVDVDLHRQESYCSPVVMHTIALIWSRWKTKANI